MGKRRISYRETPCVKRISRVPPVFVFFFAPWIYQFTDMDCWNPLYYYLNQGIMIVFNLKVTTWRSQTPYIPDYFLGFQTSAKQSRVETKEAQVSLNSLPCLFLCCLRSVSTLQGQVEPSFLEKRKFKKNKDLN